MLVEVVDDRAHLVVQQVNHPVVQAAQHPRARRVERHALDAVRLELELGQHGAQKGGGGKPRLICEYPTALRRPDTQSGLFSGRKPKPAPNSRKARAESAPNPLRLAPEELGFAVDWTTPSSSRGAKVKTTKKHAQVHKVRVSRLLAAWKTLRPHAQRTIVHEDIDCTSFNILYLRSRYINCKHCEIVRRCR